MPIVDKPLKILKLIDSPIAKSVFDMEKNVDTGIHLENIMAILDVQWSNGF